MNKKTLKTKDEINDRISVILDLLHQHNWEHHNSVELSSLLHELQERISQLQVIKLPHGNIDKT